MSTPHSISSMPLRRSSNDRWCGRLDGSEELNPEIVQLHERALVSDPAPNVLADRYASAPLVALWSAEHKVLLERRLWLAVLRAQRDLGVDVPDGVLDAYEAVIDQVDLGSLAARERVTRHDVKARIDEFAALAGHEHIHKGMTSRDLTENVE